MHWPGRLVNTYNREQILVSNGLLAKCIEEKRESPSQTGKAPDILQPLASLSAYLAQVINLNSCS
jgi:hypothetical protein